MPDTTRIYYIDTWFLSQNLPYYQPETLTSFTGPLVKDSEHWRVSHSVLTLPSPRSTKMVKASEIDYLLYSEIQRKVQEIYHVDFRIWQELQFKLMWRLNRGDLTTLLSFTGVGHAMFNEKQERPDLTKLVCTNRGMQYFVFEKQVKTTSFQSNSMKIWTGKTSRNSSHPVEP